MTKRSRSAKKTGVRWDITPLSVTKLGEKTSGHSFRFMRGCRNEESIKRGSRMVRFSIIYHGKGRRKRETRKFDGKRKTKTKNRVRSLGERREMGKPEVRRMLQWIYSTGKTNRPIRNNYGRKEAQSGGLVSSETGERTRGWGGGTLLPSQ